MRAYRNTFIFLMFFFLMLLSAPLWAGGTDVEQTTDVTTNVVTDNVLTGGDNTASNVASIGGSRSYGIGLGSIDVDIAQCLGSESTGVLIVQWQRLKENPWCMAETLDAKGLHEAASRVRCSIKEYSQIFESNLECLKLSLMEPAPYQPITEVEDEHQDSIDALYTRLSAIEAQGEQDTENARKAAQRANAAAHRVKQAEIEDREYAQQALEALKEYK